MSEKDDKWMQDLMRKWTKKPFDQVRFVMSVFIPPALTFCLAFAAERGRLLPRY